MLVDTITNKIFTKKTKDYTFIVLFLVIFSVFIAFAIRPSLTTAASLKKEETDLSTIDSIYEKQIVNMVTIQSQMEENRDHFPLLNQAITNHPTVNKIIEDIKKACDESAFTISKTEIGEVNLYDTKNKSLQKLLVTIEGTSSFDDILKLTQALFRQRRLKIINKIAITKDQKQASDSSQLKVLMEIEGYYL